MFGFAVSALQFLDEYIGVHDCCLRRKMHEQETNPCRVLPTRDGVAPPLWSSTGLPGACSLLQMGSFSSSFIFLPFRCVLLTLTLRETFLTVRDLLVDLAPVSASSSAYTPIRFLRAWRNQRENGFNARTERIVRSTRTSRSKSRGRRQTFGRQVFVRVRDKEL